LYTEDFWKLSGAVFYCASYFFAGGLLYLCYKKTASNLLLSCSVILILLFVSVLSLFYEIKLLNIMAFSMLLVYVMALLDTRYPIKISVLDNLGNSSYSLYLVHVPIQILVLTMSDMFFKGDRSFANSLYTLPVYVITSLLIAHYVYALYEKPIGKILRNKLL
jgi:peptidoglycan/LPS O-acetylase OafA/YrhL